MSAATVTLINAFEVPPAADQPFMAGWRRARDFLAARDGFGTTALHRALREDARLRFVNVASVDSSEAWREAVGDPEFPGSEMPFKAHPGLYEVAHEDGRPDGGDGVVLIEPFEVEPDRDAAFLAASEQARRTLAGRPGYLGTRLHRSLSEQADFRFVNVARWSSPLAFARAIGTPELERAASEMPFASQPALYQVVREEPGVSRTARA